MALSVVKNRSAINQKTRLSLCVFTFCDSPAFKVGRYYHTDWMPEDELHLSIDGLNMDAVYESLVRQIAGDKLQTDFSESLKESVERDEKRKKLKKQIAALENKMRREKQLNRQMEMNSELKKLRMQMEDL